MLKIKHKSVLFAIAIFVVGILANIVRCTDPHQEQIKSLNERYVILWQQSGPAAAIPLAEKALAISKETLGPKDSMTGIVMSNLGAIYSAAERNDLARPMLEDALRVHEQTAGPNHVYVAEVLDNLGNVYRRESKFDAAVKAFQRALLIREKLSDDQDIAKALLNLAACYEEMGNSKEADTYWPKYIAVLERLGRGNDPIIQINIMQTRAQTALAHGNYDQALPLFKEALNLSENAFGPDHAVTASSINSLTVFYSLMGQPELALPLALRHVELAEKANVGYEAKATAYGNLAEVYQALHKPDQTEEYTKKSLQIVESEAGPEHPNTAFYLMQLGAYYDGQGLYAKEESTVRRALQILEMKYGPVHPETARAQGYLGIALTQLNRFDEAFSVLSRSFTTSLASDNPYDIRRGGALALAQYYDKRGNAVVAIFFYKLAIDTFQQMRKGSFGLPQELRRSFTGAMEGKYHHLAKLLRDEGREAEYEYALSLLKEHEDLALLGDNVGANQKPGAMELSTFENEMKTLFETTATRAKPFYQEYTGLYAAKTRGDLSEANVKKLENLKEDLRAAQESLFHLFERLEVKSGKGAHRNTEEFRVSREQLDDLPSLLQKLGDQTSTNPAIIHFLPEKDSTTFLVTMPHPSASKEVKGGKGYDDLKQLIAELRAAIEKKDQSYRASACELYKALIEPIESTLRGGNIDTLMLDLSGPLRYIPFSALYNSDRCPKRASLDQTSPSLTCPSKKCAYLIEKYSIVLYTASTQKQLAAPPAERWSAFALGRSKGTGKYPPLQFVPQELIHVVRQPDDTPPLGVLTGHRYLDDDFTLSTILAIFEADFPKIGFNQPHNVLHISTHFDLDSRSPSHSKLVLNENETLTLLQIRANQQIKLDSYDLVTLAACRTGISDTANGVEVESLGATLQHKGAKSVLATLWSVQDQGAAAFVEEFYRNRGEIRQANKAAALQKTQLEFIQGRIKIDNRPADLRHPYYWGGFILMGNWL